jgi:hypothetical protein
MHPEVPDYMNRSAAAYAEEASQPPPPREIGPGHPACVSG